MAKAKKKTEVSEEARARIREGGLHGSELAREITATFLTAGEFSAAANAYFDECDARGELYGEAGLCLYLAEHNPKGQPVTLRALRAWYDGERCEYLREAVEAAYLRIQRQIETDPRYQEKGGMATRAIFMQKQKRFGGYQDRPDGKGDATVTITFGSSMDKSDFG